MAVIIGSGNVASALAPALESAGVSISQIWSRDKSHAGRLASGLKCNPQPIDDLSALRPGEDLYLVAVADDAIKEIACSLDGFGGLWAHTSGSVSADTLSAITDTYGVFYPLQTFTRGISVDISKVPIEETMRKMETTADPASVQTGPARRNDLGVMEGHMRLLPPETAELYRTVSSKIIKRYHHNECDQL